MALGRPLGRSFFARPVDVVARDLIGRVVRTSTAEGVVAVRLVETEAYAGEDDAASHAWRGPTPRNAVMYGPPGRLYVYFTYGMHWCANVSCEPEGRAAAVLLRAGEVVAGEDLARARRGAHVAHRRLASGPANLARALGLDGSWTGTDVTARGARLELRAGTGAAPAPDIVVGPRVGITRETERPWRFSLAGDPHVSGPRR
jgi:DNA-3-methyladenine glycosylase